MLLRALEDLKMLTQSEIERERYESRLKAQRDRESDLQEMREARAARDSARAEGEKIGVIRLCENLLKKPQTPAEQLACLSLEELTRMADELQAQVQQR